MNFEINLNIRLVARVCISDTLQPYGVNNLGSLLKIRTGNQLNCSLGVVVVKAAHFLDIEGSLLKNWDWESIVLLTGACSSVEWTILNFLGAILISSGRVWLAGLTG